MLEVLPFEEDLDLSGNLCYPGCVCCICLFVFTFCLLQSETFVGLIKVNETMASFFDLIVVVIGGVPVAA